MRIMTWRALPSVATVVVVRTHDRVAHAGVVGGTHVVVVVTVPAHLMLVPVTAPAAAAVARVPIGPATAAAAVVAAALGAAVPVVIIPVASAAADVWGTVRAAPIVVAIPAATMVSSWGSVAAVAAAARRGWRAAPPIKDETNINRPISVYRLGEMPIQSCGQNVSAPRGKAGARLGRNNLGLVILMNPTTHFNPSFLQLYWHPMTWRETSARSLARHVILIPSPLF